MNFIKMLLCVFDMIITPEERIGQAKDQKDITQPICAWCHENKKTIQELEKLLGTVRKAEKRTENRYYNNRTNIMEGILKEEEP